MKKKIISLSILACFLVFSLACISCGDEASKLAGIWVENSSSSKDSERMELFKDGTGSLDGISITWKTENNRMIISAFGLTQAASYKLSGKTLTFTNDDGEISVFKKIN